MTLLELYPLLKALWVVWFMLLFVGIVCWALRPAARRRFERLALIPLREE